MLKNTPLHVLRGLAMGTADAVPGVSGGTVALVLGFYDLLLSSLGDLLLLLRKPSKQQFHAAGRALLFLIPLGLGLLSAYLVATRMLVGTGDGFLLREDTAPGIYAAFFAAVAVSCLVPWRAMTSKRPGLDIPLLIAGILLAGGVALVPAAAGSQNPWALCGGGALAIMAMLLPGISGSLVLLVLGLYQPAIEAIHTRQLVPVAGLAAGIVIGAALGVPALRVLLRCAHDRTMAALTGLMMGSLVALWPWKTHFDPKAIPERGPLWPILPHHAWWWPVLLAVLVGTACWALECWSRKGASERLTAPGPTS